MLTGKNRYRRLATLAALALALPSCEAGGHFTLFGYTTQPNYDMSIRTVRVPIFQNKTFIRGIEFDLTQAVIREIEQKSPYKVVGPGCEADTELTGTITIFTKGLLNVNQNNEVREAEMTLGVEVVWRNLKTGEYLTRPPRRPGEAPVPELQAPRGLQLGMIGPVAPAAPQEPAAVEQPPPDGAAPLPGAGLPPLVSGVPILPEQAKPPSVLIRSAASAIPELGQSTTTAMQRNVNNIAIQIVSMMEKAW
jgi:hypothetical protein